MKEKLNYINKIINIKNLKTLVACLVILSVPYLFEFFKTPNKFDFKLNTDEKIFVLPDENKNNILIPSFLDKANESIDITIYLLSDKYTKNKIIELASRGIKLNILIEKEPFGGGANNYKTFKELSSYGYGINIKYISPKFALTHAKYIIIDKKEALIMTSNLTFAGLNKNRDFILYTSNKEYLDELNNLFNSDINYKNYNPVNDNIIISPTNSRDKIESIIKSAKSTIDIYAENVQDKNIENLLINKSEEGIKIRMIITDDEKISSNKDASTALTKNGISIKELKIPYQHAKIIIIDKSLMYLGSINLSTYSMDKNREVGVITLNKESINKVQNIFDKDFQK